MLFTVTRVGLIPRVIWSLQGDGRELLVKVLAGATCARHTEFLHNGCGANDAPRDMNSLAPVRHDAWSSLPHHPSDQFRGKQKIQDKLKVSSLVLDFFKSDHSGLECELHTAEKSAAVCLFVAQPDKGETI